MGLKRKMLYATILASSCLLSTTVVKADQVDANQEQNVSQNVTNQPNSSVSDKPINNDLDQTETPDTTTPKESTTIQNKNQNQSQLSNQSNVQTTQANSQIASDKQIDGVYTVNNNGYIPLYYADGSVETNRALAANSAWYTDTYHTLDSGNSYYRVATNEFVPVDAVTVM